MKTKSGIKYTVSKPILDDDGYPTIYQSLAGDSISINGRTIVWFLHSFSGGWQAYINRTGYDEPFYTARDIITDADYEEAADLAIEQLTDPEYRPDGENLNREEINVADGFEDEIFQKLFGDNSADDDVEYEERVGEVRAEMDREVIRLFKRKGIHECFTWPYIQIPVRKQEAK